MLKISQVFESAREHGRKVLIPFITAGDPDFKITRRLCKILKQKGADIIELGVPFSDPLADGPVIQRASQRALTHGVSLHKICEFAKELRSEIDTPIALMSYYNPILRPGLDKTVGWMKEAGIDGLICPDLPPEEAEELIDLGLKSDIAIIFFLAPTSTLKRIDLVARKSTGFIYYVSVTGVTGARETLPAEIKGHVEQIRGVTDMPIAVGFGISSPKQASEIVSWSDGVIVGSAIIKILEKSKFSEEGLKQVGVFVEKLKNAVG